MRAAKVLPCLLAAALMLGCAGCGTGQPSAEVTAQQETEQATAQAEEPAAERPEEETQEEEQLDEDAQQESEQPEEAPAEAGEDSPEEEAPAAAGEDNPAEEAPSTAGEGNPAEEAPSTAGEGNPEEEVPSEDAGEAPSAAGKDPLVTVGSETYRGFVVDNVLHDQELGDIHYNLYVPDSYDGSQPYALFITLPGYGGYYFQGVGINLRQEAFGFEAQRYNDRMIIAAPQLNDRGQTSASQTIALTEHLLSQYNIDPERVYLEGYSGGGETGSLVMGQRPELYAAYLAVSTQWDGDLEVLAQAQVPVYLAVGEDDSYYGSEPLRQAYSQLCALYEQQGLSQEEIDRLVVLDVRDAAYFTERGYADQHAGGGAFAYDDSIMGWLFAQ